MDFFDTWATSEIVTGGRDPTPRRTGLGVGKSVYGRGLRGARVRVAAKQAKKEKEQEQVVTSPDRDGHEKNGRHLQDSGKRGNRELSKKEARAEKKANADATTASKGSKAKASRAREAAKKAKSKVTGTGTGTGKLGRLARSKSQAQVTFQKGPAKSSRFGLQRSKSATWSATAVANKKKDESGRSRSRKRATTETSGTETAPQSAVSPVTCASTRRGSFASAASERILSEANGGALNLDELELDSGPEAAGADAASIALDSDGDSDSDCSGESVALEELSTREPLSSRQTQEPASFQSEPARPEPWSPVLHVKDLQRWEVRESDENGNENPWYSGPVRHFESAVKVFRLAEKQSNRLKQGAGAFAEAGAESGKSPNSLRGVLGLLAAAGAGLRRGRGRGRGKGQKAQKEAEGQE